MRFAADKRLQADNGNKLIMADEISNSLIDIGKLSKPADTLIKKIAKGVGGFAAPWQIKRVAKADAEAAIIKAGADIEIKELQKRAVHRFIEEEARHQQNMEEITEKAFPLLLEGADAELVEDDWISNFFDKSRIVSDDEMQALWSRILAGEANEPGTFSKRTVNLLADFDKTDADLFGKLCGFAWMIGDMYPLIFDISNEMYASNGINFEAITHLESVGLVRFETVAGFQRGGLPKQFAIHYYGQPTILTMPNDENNQLELGKVILSKAGRELAPISESNKVDGFVEYVRDHWKQFDPKDSV